MAQKEAVLHIDGPLLIVAGAGAGKTTTITHRIAHLIEKGVPGRRILAVTFTNKAAGEMRERVHTLIDGHSEIPTLATFHSLGVRVLREFADTARVPKNFSIWDRDDSLKSLKKILQDGEADMEPRGALAGISKQKSEGVTRAVFAESAADYRSRSLARVWAAYEDALRAEGALDFDDLLLRTLELLRNSPEVLEKLRDRWHYLTVDEYQDTNRAQYEIARLLAGERQNICAVGDIDQNIYSWRGADIEHLLSFESTFPGTKVVYLEENYRSTRTILSAANAVIEKNLRRKPKVLRTENETGDPIHIMSTENEMEEAWSIASECASAIRSGTSAGEIAVLYRENFQSRALEEAFLHLGVLYRVIGTRFFERREVKDVLSYLRASLNPLARTDIARIVSAPPRGIGKVTLEKMLAGNDSTLPKAARGKIEAFRNMLAQIAHAVRTLPCSEAVRFAIESSGIDAHLKKDTVEGEERLDNVRELVNLSTKYDSLQPPEGIERLLEEAALQMRDDEPSDASPTAVSLMTAHASKGLEFDVVFVSGLEQGLFPSQHEDTRDPEEERRLFYVALTRARKLLYLMYARSRLKYGSREYTVPSEFLDDIDPRLTVSRSALEPRENIIQL